MKREGFRFRPPPVPSTPALRWALVRAFAPLAGEIANAPPAEALDLAARLGLLARIASRHEPAQIESELGAAAARRLRIERARAAARELRHDATLATLGDVAARLGLAPILLKGRALVLAGYSQAGSRPSADIDLLVPARDAGGLHRALLEAGLRSAGGRAYDHQLPPLLDPAGSVVELHRHIPGVRVSGRTFATSEDLERAGALEPLPGGAALSFRVPRRPVLIAHALVHALAQHGLGAQGPGWQLVADLIDLGVPGAAAPLPPAAWLERDLSERERDAALELARQVASGLDPLAGAGAEPAGLLARHFVSCALDADYGAALKLRWLEAPLSERGRLHARLRTLLATLTPAATAPPEAGRDGGPGTGRRWLRRPFVLVGRAVAAWRAERRARHEGARR